MVAQLWFLRIAIYIVDVNHVNWIKIEPYVWISVGRKALKKIGLNPNRIMSAIWMSIHVFCLTHLFSVQPPTVQSHTTAYSIDESEKFR